jgi:ABC-2 type transport system permease protein
LAFSNPLWLIAILLVGPLLAILAVVFSLMISSRVNDPRVAEQISMVIILPVLVGFFGQVTGLFILNTGIITIVAGVMFVLDVLMVYLATRVFQREQILTRWK